MMWHNCDAEEHTKYPRGVTWQGTRYGQKAACCWPASTNIVGRSRASNQFQLKEKEKEKIVKLCVPHGGTTA